MHLEKSLRDYGVCVKAQNSKFCSYDNDDSKDVVTVSIQDHQSGTSYDSAVYDERTSNHNDEQDCNIRVSGNNTVSPCQKNTTSDHVEVDNVSSKPYIKVFEIHYK